MSSNLPLPDSKGTSLLFPVQVSNWMWQSFHNLIVAIELVSVFLSPQWPYRTFLMSLADPCSRTPGCGSDNKPALFALVCGSALFLTGLSTGKLNYIFPQITRGFVSSWSHGKPTRHLCEIKKLIIMASMFIMRFVNLIRPQLFYA